MQTRTAFLIAVLVACMGFASAGEKRKRGKTPPPPAPLTEAGRQLEAQYTEQLESLKTELKLALPEFDEQKKAAYLQVREAEKAAEAKMNAAQKGLDAVKRAETLLGIAKDRLIPDAEKGIETTKSQLAKATTDEERAALQEALTKWEKKKESALKTLETRQAELVKMKAEEPTLIKQFDVAEKEYAQARSQVKDAMRGLGLGEFLARDTLDAKLAKYVILTEATPNGLAAFAQEGEEQAKLVKALLADNALMVRMAVADGAKGNNYGKAMKIYTDIQKASTKAKEGVLNKLALAISLEHAVPVQRRNPTGLTDAPATVAPVERYLQFEKAYLVGELDPGFKRQSAWALRMVVDGYEPDEILVWGRKMLRNYRPDHVTTSDYKWRYVAAVKTEIRYGSQDNKYDKPELQFFQNILMNGGICGRRAFFGRFILRAFGIPTCARPQRGHAALAHWSPEGWVVCLGAKWGYGSTPTRYKKDLDFLANTQARENEKAFMQVKRAQWMGDVMGEEQFFGFHAGDPGFWYLASLHVQLAIIERAKAVALAAVGEDIGEANEPTVKDKIEAATIVEKDKTVTVDGGVITIPAAACSKPTNNTEKIKFMPSNLGGMQLHYGRLGSTPETFEYTFDVPKAGRYALTARVVTPSWKQHLFVSANGAKESVAIPLPFTVGMWDKTEPVEIVLAEGKNVLTFSRKHEGLKGVTIRDFTLKPVRN